MKIEIDSDTGTVKVDGIEITTKSLNIAVKVIWANDAKGDKVIGHELEFHVHGYKAKAK